MIRVAQLSFWHVHSNDYVRQAAANPATEITVVWDEDPERGKAQAAELGVPFEADLKTAITREDVDAVIVETPTTMHREVMLTAAAAGKHIFTEKVVATTIAELDEIYAAIDAAGLILTVSLPRLYDGYTAAAQSVLDSGRLGDITLVRTRLSHGGALGDAWLPERFFDAKDCGGGALIDLGCHPMYLARLFLGQRPDAVSASFGFVTGREVEDNAVATLRCADGALGVVEAGFVNNVSPFAFEIYGTEGALFYGTPDNVMRVRAGKDESWSEVEIPADGEKPFARWVAAIESKTPVSDNVAAARDLTALMEAANSSAASGTVTPLVP